MRVGGHVRDEELIEEWFYQYQSYIANFLVYYTGRRDVEDLVQEVFVKAFLHQKQFREQSSPKTWLISIARNLAIDQRRKEKLVNFVFFGKMKEQSTNKSFIEDQIIQKNDLLQIKNALEKLKRSYRDAIILRGIMDLSVKECASILGWSESKVNVTFHRAIDKLRGILMVKEEKINGLQKLK
jgi:RNA polymerase sigma-70 factor, ECF subfamily